MLLADRSPALSADGVAARMPVTVRREPRGLTHVRHVAFTPGGQRRPRPGRDRRHPRDLGDLPGARREASPGVVRGRGLPRLGTSTSRSAASASESHHGSTSGTRRGSTSSHAPRRWQCRRRTGRAIVTAASARARGLLLNPRRSRTSRGHGDVAVFCAGVKGAFALDGLRRRPRRGGLELERSDAASRGAHRRSYTSAEAFEPLGPEPDQPRPRARGGHPVVRP